MAWGAVTFKSGYDTAGETDNLKNTLQWATDYFIGCHTGPKEFIGQVVIFETHIF